MQCALILPSFFFFFNDTATTEIYTLSLHDALPIYPVFAVTTRRAGPFPARIRDVGVDRKSTRLNSSHVEISYAVFCLKKKQNNLILEDTRQLGDGLTFLDIGCGHGFDGDVPLQRSLAQAAVRYVGIDPVFFFLMIGRPPRPTLFPYTTLFRPGRRARQGRVGSEHGRRPPLRRPGCPLRTAALPAELSVAAGHDRRPLDGVPGVDRPGEPDELGVRPAQRRRREGAPAGRVAGLAGRRVLVPDLLGQQQAAVRGRRDGPQ